MQYLDILHMQNNVAAALKYLQCRRCLRISDDDDDDDDDAQMMCFLSRNWKLVTILSSKNKKESADVSIPPQLYHGALPRWWSYE